MVSKVPAPPQGTGTVANPLAAGLETTTLPLVKNCFFLQKFNKKNIQFPGPVKSCQADGVTVDDGNTQSGCVGGASYTCSNQASHIINSTMAYG